MRNRKRIHKRRRSMAIMRGMQQGPSKAALQARHFVARRIKELRQARGLSGEKLCTKAGLYRGYIGVIERSEKGVGIDVLANICEALGISLQELFDEKSK